MYSLYLEVVCVSSTLLVVELQVWNQVNPPRGVNKESFDNHVGED